MLEALIDPATGDVIVAKPLDSVWGRCEINRVVKLDDPELEKALSGREHVVYPYAAYETVKQTVGGREIERQQLLERSVVKIKVETANISEVASTKSGVLRAADADAAVAVAEIGEIVDPKASRGGDVVKPDRPLPGKK